MPAAISKFELQDLGSQCLVLSCTGGLSWEDRELLANQIDAHLAHRSDIRGLVMDLAGVESVNSAGVGALFLLNRRLRDHQARLAFANVPPLVLRVFRAVGLNRLAGIADNVDQARAWVEQADDAETTIQTTNQPTNPNQTWE